MCAPFYPFKKGLNWIPLKMKLKNWFDDDDDDNDNGSEEVEEIERKLHEKCGGIVVAASPFKIRNRCNIQPFTRARMQANAQSLLTAHIRYITKCTPPFPFIQKAKLQASNIFLFGYYVCGFAVVYNRSIKCVNGSPSLHCHTYYHIYWMAYVVA